MTTDRPREAPDPSVDEVLDALDTEGRDRSRSDLDVRDTLGLVLAMNDEDAVVAGAVRRAAPAIARLAEAVASAMAGDGRLIYVGAGTAGRVGQQDAAELPPTFGVDPSRAIGVLAGGMAAATQARENVEDDDQAGAAVAADLAVGPGDVLIGIAASGRTPYTIAAVRAARERGAVTGAVVCNSDSALAAAADIAVEVVVGPEFIAGSTRLKAGTAQKLVLNTVSTVGMIRAGKTYGDLMVDVRATNEKLRVRARRIVAQAAGVEDAAANGALAAAGGDVRTAIIHLVAGLPVEQAALVAASFTSLRDALAAAGGAAGAAG